MKNIVLFVLGMLFGIVFQQDIPIINTIDFQGIRTDIMKAFQSYQKQEESHDSRTAI